MRKRRYPNRFFIAKRASLVLCLIFITFILTSCRQTLAEQTTRTSTSVPSIVPPTGAQEQPSLIPSATLTQTARSTITPTPTRTPYPPTITPIPCPPFSIDTELPEPDIPENYIGRHFDELRLPEGLILDRSQIIRNESEIFEYGFSRLQWQQNRYMYWLEKLVCRDKKGEPYFEIIDAIASPSLEGNETETDLCFIENELIPFVLAIGTYDPSSPILEIGESEPGKPYVGRQYNHIVFAFQTDMERGKFIELDTTDLFCLEYPYGR